MDKYDFFAHPLVERSASAKMAELWGQRIKVVMWRELWIALAKSQFKLGLTQVVQAGIDQMVEMVYVIDFERALALERVSRHDVVAHIRLYGEAAPLAAGFIHLGATSSYVTDNADLMLMRVGLNYIVSMLVKVVEVLRSLIVAHRDVVVAGFTHFQPAQPVTVGKRLCLWCQDLIWDLIEVERQLVVLDHNFLGVRGATGTQASFLALFNGDHSLVAKLESLVAEEMGFIGTVPVAGQTYSRKIDIGVVNCLAGVSVSAHKIANDIRLLSGLGELAEPRDVGQVGSSAMPHKRNPMLCERMTGLSRYLMGLVAPTMNTAAEQWLERSLDDSSVRRMVIPESFLCCDGILRLLYHILSGLCVNSVVSDERLRSLPSLLLEGILMEGAKRGGDRQELHDVLRGYFNDVDGDRFLDLVSGDVRFAGVDFDLIRGGLAGCAVDQSIRFVDDVVKPVLDRHAARLAFGDVEGIVI